MVPEDPKGPGPVGVLRSMASALASRAGWLRQAGITFNGKRDLYEALGYPREILLSQLRAQYLRNEIAGRVIDALPKATWRGGGEVIEDPDPEVMTPFEQAWQDLENRLHVWHIFQRADILAGLGRYSVILLGGPGFMDTPLEKCAPKDLRYMTPYAEEDAPILTWDMDDQSERFGLPVTYQLRRTVVGSGPTLMSRTVHWTRIIHVADGCLDDSVYGTPRLERIWNRLLDLEKVAGGGAEAFWKRADQGLQLNIDPSIKAGPEDLAKMTEEIDEYVDGFRRIVRTRGVEMKPLGSDVANFGPSVDALIGLISAGTGIPQRILMGSERGELASTQDKTNWDDRVSDRRDEFAGPVVVHQTVDRFVSLGILPEPKKPYYAVWPEEKNMSDLDRAAYAEKLAGLNNLAGDTVVLASEIRDKALDFEPLTEEQQAEIQAKKDEEAAKEEENKAITQQQHDDNVKVELAKKGLIPPSKAMPQLKGAVARSLVTGTAAARRGMLTQELRAAVARNDRKAIARILERGVSTVGTHIRKAVERSL